MTSAAIKPALALLFCCSGFLPTRVAAGDTQSRSGSVRMSIRGNRVFVPLLLTGPNGRSRTALFWVDSGGDTLFLSRPLAQHLGLTPTGGRFNGMGNTPAEYVSKPVLKIEQMGIDVTDVQVASASSGNSNDAFAGVAAEGFLPARVIRKYVAVFDYPGNRFTLAEPGAARHDGAAVPLSIHPRSGFARIEAAINGVNYGFMVDTGAAYTGLSQRVMREWSRQHPSWARSTGAVGVANMVGKDFDVTSELLRLPKIRLGRFELAEVGMVSRPEGIYERVMADDMSGPIIGALSGNVLRHFRLELDFPGQTAYLKQVDTTAAHDLDTVGLVIQVRNDGSVVVSGVPVRDSLPEVAGVQPDDLLLRVNGYKVTGKSLAEVLNALAGKFGEKKQLLIRRGSKELTFTANVLAHP